MFSMVNTNTLIVAMVCLKNGGLIDMLPVGHKLLAKAFLAKYDNEAVTCYLGLLICHYLEA
jgi:hypothetical protein